MKKLRIKSLCIGGSVTCGRPRKSAGTLRPGGEKHKKWLGKESQFKLLLASCYQKLTFEKQNKKLPAKTEQQEPDLESHIGNPQIDKIV